VIESTNLAPVSPATVAATAKNAELVFAIGGSAMKLALGRVDKPIDARIAN
jgi:hypothetical protein